MTTIQDMLASLNQNFSQVTDLIPNKAILFDEPDLDGPSNTIIGQILCVQSDGKVLFGCQNYWDVYDSESDLPRTKNILLRYNVDGTLDSTFDPPIFGNDGDEIIRAIAQQSDGKIIIGGSFNNVNNVFSERICRLNTDGSVDETFAVGTGFNDDVFSIAVQSNNCIVVGGKFTEYDGNTATKIVILNADGSYDSDVKGPNTVAVGLNDIVHKVVVNDSDKIFVGGQFTSKIICLDSNGSEDTGFDIESGFSDEAASSARVNDFAIQEDGKILVAHWFRKFKNSDIPIGLTRLNTDGSLDTSFHFYHDDPINIFTVATSSGGQTIVTCVSPHGLSNGDMVRISGSDSDASVDGDWRVSEGPTTSAFIIEFDGVTTAGTAGTVVKALGFSDGIDNDTLHRVQAVAIQEDGKIIVGGFFSKFGGQNQNYIVRLEDDGFKDISFEVDTKFYLAGDNERVNDIAVDSDGNIYLAHDLYYYDHNPTYGLTKLDSTGDFQTLETLWRSDPDASGYGAPMYFKVKKQSDGKIIVAGDSERWDNRKDIRRLNSDGSDDSSFIPCFISGMFRDFDFQGEKIIVVGDFYEINGFPCHNIARLNSDGTVDDTFDMPNYIGNTIFAVKVAQDNTIWIGGDFTQVGSTTVERFCQLTEDGELLYHDDHLGLNNQVHVIKEDSDGKILVGGQFYNSAITPVSIATGSGTVEIDCSANHFLETGDYVLIQGSDSTPTIDGIWEVTEVSSTVFSIETTVTVSGTAAVSRFPNNYLFRLNADKTIDDTFVTKFETPFGGNPRVADLDIQDDGKIVVAHWFENYDGNSSRFVTRINSDASYDDTFATEGTGLEGGSGGAMSIKVDENGKVYVGGWFNTYDGADQRSLIRLNSDGTKDSAFDIQLGFDNEFPNYNGTRVTGLLVDGDSVYCCGGFSIYNQTIRWGLVKINSDGNVNTSFNVVTPFKTVGINDGVDDLFDEGHFINTNLTQTFAEGQKNYVNFSGSIPNTHTPCSSISIRPVEDFALENFDGTVQDGEKYFGTGSSYFTNLYPGLLVLAATEVSEAVNEVSILGESADSPDVVVSTLSLSGGFKAFVRKEINGEPKCLHQMIIVNDSNGTANVGYNDDSDENDFVVNDVFTSKVFVLLMTTEGSSSEITDEELTTIGNKFLSVLGISYKTLSINIASSSGELGPRNLDTAILNGHSIQKTGILEIVNSQGQRKMEVFNDGDTFTDEVQNLEDYLSIKKL